MTDVLRIEAKVIGRKKPLFDDWSIPIPPQAARDGGRITLRDLITWTVVEEVEAFRQRQAARRLETVLTRIQIWSSFRVALMYQLSACVWWSHIRKHRSKTPTLPFGG